MAPTTKHFRFIRWRGPPTHSGPGKDVVSPLKPRDPRRKHRREIGKARAAKNAGLVARLDALLAGAPLEEDTEDPQPHNNVSEDVEMQGWVDEGPSPPPPPVLVHLIGPTALRNPKVKLCTAWEKLLPQLYEPWAQYRADTYALPPPHIASDIRYSCTGTCSQFQGSTVRCLYPTCKLIHLQPFSH